MKNKINDRERIEMKKYCKWDRAAHPAQGDPIAPVPRRSAPLDGEPARDLPACPGPTRGCPTTSTWSLPPRPATGEAFDALVRQTYLETYTLAYRLTGNEEDARDVVQETYLRAYRGLRRFRGDAQFSTWLYRITANCASTHLGRRARHRHDELDLDMADEQRRASGNPEVSIDAVGAA